MPLQYRDLEKTWLEVTWGLLTPSAGNRGCFLAGLSMGHGGWVVQQIKIGLKGLWPVNCPQGK